MADTKISALTAVVTPAGTDEFAVNQGGTTKKITLTQVRSSVPTTSLTGTLSDATVAESNVTQHEAAIDHDALTNFVANEHINHGSVSITAGDGLTGGGDLTTTRTVDVDINGTTDLAAPATNDELLISDLSATNAIRKADVASIVNLADHDALTNFVANEHVNHSSVSLSAGAGIAAGGLGDLTASRTIAVDGVLEDLDTLGAATANGELIVATGAGVFQYEDAQGATFRATLATGTPSSTTFLRGDSTWAVPASEVSISGTPVNNQLAVWTDASTIEGDAGLTWDGTNLTTTGSIFIQEKAEAAADVAGYGQLWVDLATPNVLYFTDDAGTDQQIVYASGAFHDGFTDFVANEHIDHTSVTLTAGAGLTGGGTIAANRTFNVGAGTGITVNADDVAITAGGVDTTQLADEGVTNAKLAHAAAWTFKIRNAGTTGDPSDAAAANFTEDLTPASGDFAIGFDASNQIRKYDIGNFPFINNVVEDTTPQLGGQLDVNGQAIGDGTLELLTFTETGSAVNHINITNNTTTNAPILSAAGDDANIDLSLQPKGTGDVLLGTLPFDGNQTVGVGQDGFILTYNNGTGLIELTAAAGGGNVSNTGTPLNDQIAVWTNATTIEGTTGLTWDGTDLVAGNSQIQGADATASGRLILAEDTDNGSNTITIAAPASIASNKTVTFEDVTGTVYVTGGTDVAVADGGTGVSTLTSGNVLVGAGTSAVTTTKAAPTGAFVGTTDTQTLTNKTIGAFTLSGAVTGGDNTVSAVELGDYSEDTHTDATWTGAESLSYVDGPFYILTLTGNVTLTITNPPASGSVGTMTLKLTQDATGGRTVTWPAAVDWPGGTAPTLSSGANDVDIISLITHDAGTTWYGFTGGLDFA